MTSLRQVSVFWVLLACLACGVLSAAAAKYLRPGETKELFKLEKIPLQVDSMREISMHLTALALRDQDKSAEQRRGTGKLLALAVRLDPANQDARQANRALLRDDAVETTPGDKILKAKARLRFYQRWLASPEAGAEANTLAAYIDDASRVLEREARGAADSADWSKVLPPLARYRETDKKDSVADRPEGKIPPAPEKKETPDQLAGYRIAKLSVSMPLAYEIATTYRDRKNPLLKRTRYSTSYAVSPVTLEIFPGGSGVVFKVATKLGRGNGNDDAAGFTRAVKGFEKRLNSSPTRAGARITLGIGGGRAYSAENGNAALAAVKLMLHASRANRGLRKDIHFCAALDRGGKLCLPANFWSTLTALRKDDGKTGRLIVPKAAAAPLTQLLVYGEPDFFTRWEVFTVADMDEALAVAAKSSSPELAQATELYAPVRKLSGKSDVTKIAVNHAVRKRLDQVLKLAPNHLSASALLLQGSGHRPMRLSKTGLCFHLLPIVKRMNSELTKLVNVEHPRASVFKKMHEEARAGLDPVERIVSRTDGDLYKETLKLANDLRSLSLLVKRSSRADQSDKSARNKVRATVLGLQASASQLEEKVRSVVDATAEK